LCHIPARKMTVFRAIFLLNKDISQLWYELGHNHEKNMFFMSELLTCIPKYLSIVQFFTCVPKIFNNCTIFAKLVSHFFGRDRARGREVGI